MQNAKCGQCGQSFDFPKPSSNRRFCGLKCARAYFDGRPKKSLAQAFWPKVNKGASCWAWTGAKDAFGYGVLGVNGSTEKAHRVSWAIHNGSIPSGLFVCHTCDTPSCVNPAHLWLGNALDNNRDRDQKGRGVSVGVKGERHRWSKLSLLQVQQIRGMRGTMYQREIAKLYGISRSAVSSIWTGKVWAHDPLRTD